MEEIISVEEPVAVPTEVSEQSKIVPSSSHDDGDERVKQLDQHWVSSIEQRLLTEPAMLTASSSSSLCSIHRVPPPLRQHNDNAFDPQIISIGPYHYEKRKVQLRAMEEHKWRYLHDVLARNPEGSLKQHLVAIIELEEKARKCYSEVIKLDTNSFVEMMLLDGCFIIEFVRRSLDQENNDDVIIHLQHVCKAINTDLTLFENQIPFFILQQLFALVDPKDFPRLETEVIIYFSDRITEQKIKESNKKIHHLLHLHHTDGVLLTEEKCPAPYTLQRIPCASKLVESGIKFEKKDDKNDNFLNINFHKEKGVIEIPELEVFRYRNITLLNLIAFEQSYLHCHGYFTAYITFMDDLINGSEDAEILCQKGIIKNELGNEEKVADFFNDIGRRLNTWDSEFYLSGVCKEINRYSQKAWPKLRASLLHDYFKNPWAIIAFLASLLLLFLTLIQSFFAAFPKFSYGK